MIYIDKLIDKLTVNFQNILNFTRINSPSQSTKQVHKGVGNNIIMERKPFTANDFIITAPSFLGGKDYIDLDGAGQLRLTAPYSENSVTILIDAVPVTMNVEHATDAGVKIADAQFIPLGNARQYVFNTTDSIRNTVEVGARRFVITLNGVGKPAIPDVANPLEFRFGISEVV